MSPEKDAVDALVRDGVREEARGRREEAVAALEKAVAKEENHAVARLHLGANLAALGRAEKALPHLRRALDLSPNSPAFHLFAGRAYFDAGRDDEALERFLRAAELNPTNDLARAYALLARWATGDGASAGALDPDHLPESTAFLARLLMLIERDLKGRAVEYVRSNGPPPLLDRVRVGLELWRAMRARKSGDFDRAALHAEIAQEMRPGHPATVAFLRECREAALGVARRAVEEAPESAERRLALASALADHEQFDAAQAEMDAAARLGGEQKKGMLDAPFVLRLRGRIAYGLGRVDEAVELIQNGAEPGFPMAEVNYYLGLCRLAQGQRFRCLEQFEALVSKVCWAVPLRLRERQAWRAQPATPGEVRT